MNTANVKLAYSVPEVAEMLGVCEQTVRNMCYEHKLPHIKVGLNGGRTIIPCKALHEYLEKAVLPIRLGR